MQARRRLSDGRILTVYAELFGTGVIAIDDNPGMHEDARRSGEPTESDGGFDFYFQFASVAAAEAAYELMTSADREPTGWIRARGPHPGPMRRRPGGDPARETVDGH